MFFGAKYGILGAAVGVLISRVFDSIVKLIYLSFKLSVSFLDVIKSLLTPTWLITIVAIVSYLIVCYANYGEYVGVFVFGVICLAISACTPKIFGKDFYESIYLVAKEKIVQQKQNNEVA